MEASEVDGETWLYRLIKTTQCKVKDGAWELTSAAFANSTEFGHELEMSVVLGDTLEDLDRFSLDLPDHAYPTEPDEWGVAKLKAGCADAVEEQVVVRSPNAFEQAHGDVLGHKTGGRRKALRRCADWVVRPARDPDPPSP